MSCEHDWEVVEYQTGVWKIGHRPTSFSDFKKPCYTTDATIAGRFNGGGIGAGDPYCISPTKKVCLLCEEAVDEKKLWEGYVIEEVAEAGFEYLKEERRKADRKKKAKEIWVRKVTDDR